MAGILIVWLGRGQMAFFGLLLHIILQMLILWISVIVLFFLNTIIVKLMDSLSAPLMLVGIRFRMCMLVFTTGKMVICLLKARMAMDGLPILRMVLQIA